MTDYCVPHNDYYAPHNHWCQTYDGMAGYPDEEGDWVNTEEWVYNWLKERMFRYPNKPARLHKSRKGYGKNGFVIERFPEWFKLPGWDKLKENEGYFYLKLDKREWYIRVEDVYATYEMIMRIQDRIMAEYGE